MFGVILLAGLCILLYPTVSNFWNSKHQSRAIVHYVEDASNMDAETYEHFWKDAQEYNSGLLDRVNPFMLTDEKSELYDQLMDINGSKIMCYVEIPKIETRLPVYHGTEDTALQVAIGHIEWSSLPVGGISAHRVLSGHRGLPRAKLFTNLDKLEIGDHFMLHVLDTTLTYEVDQILVVESKEMDSLQIEEGKDLYTLVTCTPYGINSHRLLVRGHRVENDEQVPETDITAQQSRSGSLILPVVILLIAVLIIAAAIYILIRRRKTQDGQ